MADSRRLGLMIPLLLSTAFAQSITNLSSYDWTLQNLPLNISGKFLLVLHKSDQCIYGQSVSALKLEELTLR